MSATREGVIRSGQIGIAIFFGLAIAMITSFQIIQHANAVCSTPSPDKGIVTATLTNVSAGSFRVWSRLAADPGNAANNSYLLEIDGGTCYTVGDAASPALPSTWQNNSDNWVDYVDGNTASKLNVTLTAGNHTVRLIGREDNVKLDRVMFLSNTGCVPTDKGTNCESAPDTTPPTVSITTPSNNQTVSGNSVNINITATDDSAINKVELLVDNVLTNTDTTAPYAFVWDSTSKANGNHSLVAKAYDTAGNTAQSSTTVNVNNTTTPPPPPPSCLAEDINRNGTVDFADFTAVVANYGRVAPSANPRINVDGSSDGRVTFADFTKVVSKYGQSSGCI